MGNYRVYILFIQLKTLRQDPCGDSSVIGLQLLVICSALKVLKHHENTIPSAFQAAYVKGTTQTAHPHFQASPTVPNYSRTHVHQATIYVDNITA